MMVVVGVHRVHQKGLHIVKQAPGKISFHANLEVFTSMLTSSKPRTVLSEGLCSVAVALLSSFTVAGQSEEERNAGRRVHFERF